MIRFDNVSKRYPGGHQALSQVSFELGEGDPMWETSTGSLYWVDEREQILEFQQVGPVAWSEGCLMASLIYARRQVKEQSNG